MHLQHYTKTTIKVKTAHLFLPEDKELKMKYLMEPQFSDVANIYPLVLLYKFTPFLLNFSKNIMQK